MSGAAEGWGRVTVCTAGYSHLLGFIRIYPTRTDMPWNNWDIVQVEVDDDIRDPRQQESWKIARLKVRMENLADKVTVTDRFPREKRLDLIGNLEDECVHDINSERRSLGVIKPQVIKRYFGRNDQYGRLFQLALPELAELLV